MKIKHNIRVLITLGGLYLGAALASTAAITVLRVPFEFAQKKLFNETKKEYRGTLKDIGYSSLLQTKGILMYGDFETENGDRIRVYDSARVLEGKLFDNTRLLDKKEIGKTYELKTIGSEKTGYTLLEAKLQK